MYFRSLFLTALAGVSAQDSERKVPPRTPMQRFNTLHRFINDWIDANVDATLNRPQRADKMKSAFQRIFDAQSAAFVRCGFFDPNVAHGKFKIMPGLGLHGLTPSDFH